MNRKIFFAFLAFLCSASVFAAEKLLWHDLRLDEQGKLLAWSEVDSPYSDVVCRAWNAFKKIPTQPNGYKTYIVYPVFYGPGDPQHPLFSGREWTHNPAGLFAMLTDGAILYYPYSGDEEIMPLVRGMLDHAIAYGSTSKSDAWSQVPYASSDAGDPNYHGANDKQYEKQMNDGFLGRGDGVGVIEPDKVGELGLAYLQFYEFSLEKKYLKAARHCADALARHVRDGNAGRSPWPFRVDAHSGTVIREDYTANAIGPIKLLDEMIRLGEGDTVVYHNARDKAWAWLMMYPLQNNIWSQYFEDIYIYPDYRTNLNQYCPLETARYLMDHPVRDPAWRNHAQGLIEWTRSHFAIDSATMAGVPEKGLQWDAEVLSEQVNDMDKMSSHTARYASVMALWHERTGDAAAKEKAFRSFNWATYSCRDDGLVKTSLDEGTGYWFSDGYGDYMRHFLRGMASVPQWAPRRENHLLRSSSVIQSIKYEKDKIEYRTFDASGQELFKLRERPRQILLNGIALSEKENIDLEKQSDECFVVKPVANGGFAITVIRRNANKATIVLGE
jgi:hypothetical protein